MLVELLSGAAVVSTAALGVLWWYHGSKTRSLVTRAEAAETALGALRSVNDELRASLQRVVDDTAARNDREALDDASTASAAAGDPAAAAALLNGLHSDRPGPGPRAGRKLPPASTAAVPRAPGFRLR